MIFGYCAECWKTKGVVIQMNNTDFENIVREQLDRCESVLLDKSKEYAAESDRMHNFKVAAEIQSCTPVSALAGMMAKHTVSVYDLINDFEEGADIPKELWDEKITDHINYLLLLQGLLAEHRRVETDESIDCM